MASQAQIATMACLDVGGQAVSDVDNETQTEAALIRDIWDITRDELLAEHEWGFAKKYKALALDATFTEVDDDWEYIYALPSDFIKLLVNDNDAYHEIRENRLYCDTEDLIIGYIAKIEDTSKYPVWFVKALVARLRTRIYIPLGKKSSKAIEWYQLYERELEKAQTKDMQQDNREDDNKVKHTIDNDSWVSEATT